MGNRKGQIVSYQSAGSELTEYGVVLGHVGEMVSILRIEKFGRADVVHEGFVDFDVKLGVEGTETYPAVKG